MVNILQDVGKALERDKVKRNKEMFGILEQVELLTMEDKEFSQFLSMPEEKSYFQL